MVSTASGLLVIAAVLGTSILSGIFGMAGGLILMGVLATILPVPLAMTAHGFAQSIANGTRAVALHAHIKWRACSFYLIGTAFAVIPLWFISFSPSRALVFIGLGVLPFLTFLPRVPALDFQRPSHAIFCGFLVNIANLTAGVSGPLLDMFFVKAQLNRFEIVGTKSFTQSLSHLLKITYFAALASELLNLPIWLPVSIALTAIIGTQIGGVVLKRMSETNFQYYLRRLFIILGSIYLLRGIYELVSD